MTFPRFACIGFVAVHVALLLGGFLAPYAPTTQHRELPYAPPTGLHWIDAVGHFHFRPFTYDLVPDDVGTGYSEDRSHPQPVRFLVSGAEYRLFGLVPLHLHLFGTASQQGVFLLGTDAFGRDQLSRLIYGGQLSMAAAALATLLALGLGLMLGTAAGFYGGISDDVLMRGADLGLCLPWIYVLLGIRAYLPLQISAVQAFFLVAVVMGMIGWARPARLFRNATRSARQRTSVIAASGFGASDLYLVRVHILPQVLGIALTQLVVLLPQFVVGEVTLSFIGLGIAEPATSWGSMLSILQQYHVLTSYWWMSAPIFALIFVSLSYFGMASAIQQRVKSVAL